MDVVRHDNKLVLEQINVRAQFSGAEPFLPGDDPGIVQSHFTILDGAKKVFTVVSDDGDEVSAFGGVVVPTKADGAAVVGRGWFVIKIMYYC